MAKKTSKKTKSKRNKKKGFKYQSRSKQDHDRSSSESSGQFDAYIRDGIPAFRPHDGANRIRVLPPTFEDPADFAFTILVHYGIGADEQTYLCRKMIGEDEECVICDEQARLMKEGEADDAADFKHRKRKATWLIDRKAEESDPLFWAMPFGTWKDTVLVCKDEDGEVIELDHPEEGHDVMFTKEGAKKRTKYTGVRLGKQRPIVPDEDDMERILSFIQENPLNEVLVFFDNEYLQSVLEGQVTRSDDDDDEDDDEEEEEEKTRRRKKTKSKSKKSKKRDEDEDDDDDEDKDDDDEDPDEDPDEMPDEDEIRDMDEDELEELVESQDLDVDLSDYKSLKKKVKAVLEAIEEEELETDPGDDDDEDKDDEDDDEEEEEEKSRRRKKTKSKKKESSASRLKDAARRARKTTKTKKDKRKTSKRRR